MRLSCTVILLLGALLSLSFSQNAHSPKGCCLKYNSGKPPAAAVTSCYVTDHTCPLPAVRITTRRGHKLCMNPDEPGNRKIMERCSSLSDKNVA